MFVLGSGYPAPVQPRHEPVGGRRPHVVAAGAGVGPEAEKAAEEVRKGSLVTVSGRVKADEWQDKQTGETRKSTTLVADVVYVHPPKDQQGQGGGFQQPQADPWGSAPTQQQGFGGGQDDAAPF